MTLTTSLADYADRHVDGDVLGKIVPLSVFETLVDTDQVTNLLDAVGLKKYAPKRPADSDVFRRVTKAAQARIPQDDGTTINLMVREVAQDARLINRRIVMEHVDGKNKRLDYGEAWDLIFDKESGSVHTARMNWHPAVEGLGSQIRDAYLAERGKSNANAIRTAITRALVDNKAVSVRPSGGVWFVPRDNMGVVDGLEAFAGQFPSSVWLHSIPLPDDPKQRAMVEQAVETNAMAELRALLAEARDTDTPPTGRRAASMVVEANSIRERVEEYRKLLAIDLGGVNAEVDMLDGLLVSLVKASAVA